MIDGDQNEVADGEEEGEDAACEADGRGLSSARVEHYRRLIADGTYEQQLDNLAEHLMSMGVDAFLLE